MRQQFVLRLLFIFLGLTWVTSTFAQGADEKQMIKLQARISEDSAKLVKIESLVPSFEKEKKDKADNAQHSADDNKRAAERLSNDPQDKGLARKARNAASSAKRDAKAARVAADKLDYLNLDIQKLTKKLTKEQDKRQSIQQNTQPAASSN